MHLSQRIPAKLRFYAVNSPDQRWSQNFFGKSCGDYRSILHDPELITIHGRDIQVMYCGNDGFPQ